MASDEENKLAANLVTIDLIRALIDIYGYDAVYLGAIEDILADRIIAEGFEKDKKLKEIVEESGRSLSTVKRRKEEYLGIKEKKSDK